MRLIGHLAEEKAARTFADYLYVQGIDSHIEDEKPDGWGIWINDEDKIDEAVRFAVSVDDGPRTVVDELEHNTQQDWEQAVSDGVRHRTLPLTIVNPGYQH